MHKLTLKRRRPEMIYGVVVAVDRMWMGTQDGVGKRRQGNGMCGEEEEEQEEEAARLLMHCKSSLAFRVNNGIQLMIADMRGHSKEASLPCFMF